MDTKQREHTAGPATAKEDESSSRSPGGGAPSGQRGPEMLAKAVVSSGAPVSSSLRKSQVRAALFRKLEPIRIGRFILLEPLGAGAMGEIYAAYDDQLDRKVALKLVKSGSGLTAKADERLLREAQTLAQVSHPNVVQIYEAGTYNGRLFIAMELIRGKTLTSWLKDAEQVPRAVRQREILHQFIAAGRGLEAAHAAGLAHRDFKPDNVLVGDDGRVRVVDFGLARALVDEPDDGASAWSGRELDADSDAAETIPGDDRAHGDVAPAAPKLGAEDIASGQTMPLDSEALDGAAMGDDLSGRSVPLVMDGPTMEHQLEHQPGHQPGQEHGQARRPARAATADPPAKPRRGSTSDPSSSAPKLKAAVRLTETGTVMGTPSYMAPETLRGAVADQRSDQFSFCVALYHALYNTFPFSGKSLRELRDAMESGEVAFVPSVPVPAFARKALYRGLSVNPAQRFASMGELLTALTPKTRRRRAWIAAAASLVAIALGGGMYLRSQAQVDPCATAGAAIDAAWPIDRQVAVQAMFGRSGLPFAESAWRGVKAGVDGYTNSWRNQATAACQATYVAHTQSAEQLDKRMLCLDRGKRQLAALVTELGTGAPDVVEHAVEATEALPDLDACSRAENLLFGLAPPPAPVATKVATARDRIARAFTLEVLGRYEESLAIARDASVLTNGLGYPPVHAEALAQVARVLDARDTVTARTEAERLYFEALDIAEAERHDVMAVEIWNQLVSMAVRLDSGMAQAHTLWRRQAAAVHRLGDAPYEQAKLHHVLAEIYFNESKFDQAAEEARVAITAMALSPAHQLELSRYNDMLAKSLERLGKLDEALRLHERALAIATREFGESHLTVIRLQTNYGKALGDHGQADRARSVLESALATMTAHYGDSHPQAARIHSFLSTLECREGHLDRAAEHGHASLAIYQRTQSPDHVVLTDAYVNLATVEFMRRNFGDALAMYEGALALRQRHLGADHYSTGKTEVSVAETLVELERYDEAMSHLVEAERIFQRGSVRERGTQAWILIVRGEILAGQRKFDAAIPVLEKALALFDDNRANKTNDLNYAMAMWTLARALHGLRREEDRVRSLAERAHAIFTAQGAVEAHNRDVVARFLQGVPARQVPHSPRTGSASTRRREPRGHERPRP